MKLANATGDNKWRKEAERISVLLKKATARLLKLEKDDAVRLKYEAIKRDIEHTMRAEDDEKMKDQERLAEAR